MSQRFRFWGSHRPSAELAHGIKAQVVAQTDGTTAKIRLYDPIDSWGGWWGVSANDFAATLDGIGSEVETIELHINSPGGEAFEGITIANMLRQHRARVVAVVDGIAASAASLVACTADEVVMSLGAELMIHDAWNIAMGNAEELRHEADVLDKLSGDIAKLYARKAGGDAETWRTAMRAETWYTAEEAVEAGLADKSSDDVADDDPDASNPSNRFDMSIFAHKGRSDAPAPPPVPSDPPSAAAGGSRADNQSAIDALELDLQLASA